MTPSKHFLFKNKEFLELFLRMADYPLEGSIILQLDSDDEYEFAAELLRRNLISVQDMPQSFIFKEAFERHLKEGYFKIVDRGLYHMQENKDGITQKVPLPRLVCFEKTELDLTNFIKSEYDSLKDPYFRHDTLREIVILVIKNKIKQKSEFKLSEFDLPLAVINLKRCDSNHIIYSDNLIKVTNYTSNKNVDLHLAGFNSIIDNLENLGYIRIVQYEFNPLGSPLVKFTNDYKNEIEAKIAFPSYNNYSISVTKEGLTFFENYQTNIELNSIEFINPKNKIYPSPNQIILNIPDNLVEVKLQEDNVIQTKLNLLVNSDKTLHYSLLNTVRLDFRGEDRLNKNILCNKLSSKNKLMDRVKLRTTLSHIRNSIIQCTGLSPKEFSQYFFDSDDKNFIKINCEIIKPT
ncbi:hypothetical protein KC678_01530 [Candidatus Dojkabacteria bacterium]|uniref:Uncharacterized protein n=1 Tax=Candidatus Dojkabacteria bacterium TaxID=2099670 RepID=A0A955IF27_9BACT|nr:hypothetical protein [Candidatus Dojkabacteria bacterium]